MCYLICGVDELHSFVGHGEDDGRHLLHLFCRLLGEGKGEGGEVTFKALRTEVQKQRWTSNTAQLKIIISSTLMNVCYISTESDSLLVLRTT